MSVRTLVICADTWHPAETLRRGLGALGDCGFDFEYLEDDTQWSPIRMNEYSLAILAKANLAAAATDRRWLTAESHQAFADYVRRGSGLVAVHSGTAGYNRLPAMRRLMGGAFVRHPEECSVTMEPKNDHPLTEGIPCFTVRDEQYFVTMEDVPADVFLHSRSEYGVQPAGWTRSEGKGRVGVLTPGHELEVWRHPSFQKLLLNLLDWTARLS